MKARDTTAENLPAIVGILVLGLRLNEGHRERGSA